MPLIKDQTQSEAIAAAKKKMDTNSQANQRQFSTAILRATLLQHEVGMHRPNQPA